MPDRLVGALAGSPAAAASASPAASTLKNPTVTFSTPGTKQVTLQTCNEAGCTSITTSVVVLDPKPVIDSMLVSPLILEAGQLFRLTATGHGQPSLSYLWKVYSLLTPIAQQGGASVWWDTTAAGPGVYAIGLDLSNATATVPALPVLVTVLPAHGSDLYTIVPCRVLDTRTAGGPLSSGVARQIAVTGTACDIPPEARAVSANITAVGPSGQGTLTVFPGNYPQAATNIVGFVSGSNRAAAAILPLASDGSGSLAAIATVAGAGTVHLIVDVNGYFL